MDKNIFEMDLQEIINIPYYRTEKEFNAIVIVPNEQIHSCGYRCMDFILCDGLEIIGKIGSCSDVLHINGIGGNGNWRSLKKTSKNGAMTYPIPWKIDCLPKSGLLRLHSGKTLEIPSFVLSEFEVWEK